MGELKLTPEEQMAKDYMIKMMTKAITLPCDIGTGNDIELTLPKWYDADKVKRGQQYFHDNRFGMLASNLCGLLTLLADPKGLKILSETGRSSTPETAKKRYASTIMHTMSWYEVDLTPGTKAWESLNRVRKLHLNASNASYRKNIGYITQTEVALTTLGFMGFALVRPHLLGISHDNDEDREAFVHFWAVMGHLLGVADEYNMCLYPLKVVEIICKFMLRYIFIPLLQFESPLFKEMVTALLEGLSDFMPHMTYDIQMFTVKRVIGVPGYQFDVDLTKEVLCRPLLTIDDIRELHKFFITIPNYQHFDITFNEGVPLIEIQRANSGDPYPIDDRDISQTLDNMDNNRNVMGKYRNNSKEINENPLFKYLGLHADDHVDIKFTDNNKDWRDYLNDTKFYDLSTKDQFVVRWRCRMMKFYSHNFGRYLCESGLSVVLFIIKKFHESKKAHKIKS